MAEQRNASNATLRSPSRIGAKTHENVGNRGIECHFYQGFQRDDQSGHNAIQHLAELCFAKFIETMLAGDLHTGKAVLRNYINATDGFGDLEAATHKSAKSLMRMLGPDGNPQAENLCEIVAYLQNKEGIRFEVRAARFHDRPLVQNTSTAPGEKSAWSIGADRIFEGVRRWHS